MNKFNGTSIASHRSKQSRSCLIFYEMRVVCASVFLDKVNHIQDSGPT